MVNRVPRCYIRDRETAVIREENESPNDRNDRGMFRAHLEQHPRT